MSSMIRESKKEELEQIMDIWLSSNLEVHSFVDASYWKENYEAVKEAIACGVTVFVNEEKVEGFLGVMDGYIAGLFVRKESRGNGIGRSLLNEAKEKNEALILHAFAKNEGAVRFYKREDFEIAKESINEDTKEIEYLMQWKR